MNSVVTHLVYRSKSFHLLPLKKLLRSIITKTTYNKYIYILGLICITRKIGTITNFAKRPQDNSIS